MNKNVNGAYVAPSCKEYCVNINAVLCASGTKTGQPGYAGPGYNKVDDGDDY